ncbi:MAG: hypothetical protein ACHQ01_09490 [Candidatus Limnocylindrales bacterium]
MPTVNMWVYSPGGAYGGEAEIAEQRKRRREVAYIAEGASDEEAAAEFLRAWRFNAPARRAAEEKRAGKP